MIIDCSECELFESDHCKDCLVTAVLSHPEEEPLVFEEEEEEAIARLQDLGLLPSIKFRKRQAG